MKTIKSLPTWGLIALIPLFFFLLVQPTFAIEIDFTEVDDRLGETLGIGAFGGGLLATLILLFVVLGCLGAAMKRQPSTLMVLFVGMSCFAFGIICTWFPVWFLVLFILLISALWGQRIVKGIG